MLDQKTLVKNIMTGKDGKLLIVIDNKSEELLEIDTYSIKGNYTNLDYQPVGSYQKFGVPSDETTSLWRLCWKLQQQEKTSASVSGRQHRDLTACRRPSPWTTVFRTESLT